MMVRGGKHLSIKVLAILIAALATTALHAEPSPPRVVVLGFDGVEPKVVEAMLEAGELPNLAKLRDQGGYQQMTSSNPPQSPTAWSNFATGKNPGGHGIYDFLRRTPQTYLPGLGFGMMKQAELGPDGTLVKPAEYVNYRKGATYWALADAAGKRCRLLQVPYAYPPESLRCGQMLCGLDVPDIRGTQSTFFAMSDQFAELENVPGGVKLPIRFTGDAATVNVPGVRYPKSDKFAEAPMKLTVDRVKHSVAIEVQGRSVVVSQGAWSEWLEWSFPLSPKVNERAISRLYVVEAGGHTRLYMTCLQFDPQDPFLPIAAPGGYAKTMADAYGLFKTVGWSDDTKAVQQGELDDKVFLADALATMDWTRKATLGELDRGGFDLLVAGWTGTDRIAHIFWRCRDAKHPRHNEGETKELGRAIESAYTKMDEIVGAVSAKLTPNDLLFVMSDHGFHSFRKAFSINTWLVRNGYLSITGQTDPSTASTDTKYLQAFDWSRTKAYALGLGGVFINLKGREGRGIVTPEEAPKLVEEIQKKLLAEKDPDTGEAVFRNVYAGAAIYKGAATADAPDLQLAYADGFQTDKASAAGAAPKTVLGLNDDKWSGDHAASDVADTPGILFANRKLAPDAALIDIAPTVLGALGVKAAADLEGKRLLP